MEIAPGVASSSPQRFAAVNNQVFTSADDGTTGFELWQLTAGVRVLLPLTIR